MQNNLALDLLYSAEKMGVSISLSESNLKVRIAKGKIMDPALVENIRNNKELIIDFLKNEKWKAKKLEKDDKIPRFQREGLLTPIPLSFNQERLWIIDQLGGSVQYQSPSVIRMNGHLDESALEQAFATIVNRHEVLRTVIEQEQGTPYQRILDKNTWRLGVDDEVYVRDSLLLNARIEELTGSPFDLSGDHMLRVNLLRLKEGGAVLVLVVHHIAADGWSMPILMREFKELYTAAIEQRDVRLPEMMLQYADYALWQRQRFTEEVLEKKINYWRQQLSAVAPLNLPIDPIRSVRGIGGGKVSGITSKELKDKLTTLSHQEGVTLYMTLLSVFNVLLYKYTEQNDICIGSSIAGRQQQEIEGLIGFFANTLALRNNVQGDMHFRKLLVQVKQTTLDAYDNQEVPFEKVVEVLGVDRELSRNPVFQVMLVLENTPGMDKTDRGGNRLFSQNEERLTAKFDITLSISEFPEGLQLTFTYSSDLYREETIGRMLRHFEQLLEAVCQQPDSRIAALNMLTTEEQQQLLATFNTASVDYPRELTILNLFDRQADTTPDNIAVAFKGRTFTYRELSQQSNQLGHYLRSKGIKEGSLVPVCLEPGMDAISAILGIMKAGAAYVPIDMQQPPERIKRLLGNIHPEVIITSEDIKDKIAEVLGNIPPETTIIDIVKDAAVISRFPLSHDVAMVKPDYLAYVIYTSGSTGYPKGVMVRHQGLVDYLYGLRQGAGINECSSFALVSPLFTDLGNTVIYSALTTGGALHVLSGVQSNDAEELHRYFRQHRIDCMKIVPSHWKALCGNNLLLPAKLLLFGGEALPVEIIDSIKLSGASCEVINHYGPTETTIGKLLHKVAMDHCYPAFIPIGRPFSNTVVYILSKDMTLCPVGVPGELYIGGEGVAAGYLNNDDLTAAAFIENQFLKQGASRLYKTGDIVKYLPDGNIMYIGRADDQVKIRGYRIEPGEIDHILRESGLVQESAVLATTDEPGHRRLVCYVVPLGKFDEERVVDYLKGRLPDYMIPSVFIELEQMPLTANGKIDRKSLTGIHAEPLSTGEYTPPRDELESTLAAIWQELLEVPQISIYDNFFKLGGHSLLAIRLVSAIRNKLSIEVSIGDIFEYPVLEQLALQLKAQQGQAVLPAITARERPSLIPLSFSQERLWFIDRMGGSVQYHIPAVLRFEGDLDKEALAAAFSTIVNRHEVLRTVITVQDGQACQQILPADDWSLKFIGDDIYGADPVILKEKVAELLGKRFDLSKDHPLRVHLISLQEKEYLLVMTMHHIASDGWSMPILVRELGELYRAYIEHRPYILPELTIQYADYAIWQRNYLNKETLRGKLLYWEEQLAGIVPLNLPADYQRPVIQSTRGAALEFEIGKDLADKVQLLSQQAGATLFMTLLAVFKVLLYRYSGQPDICVGTPVANRYQQEVEGLIGFFINTLVLRSRLDPDSSFSDLLQQIRRQTLDAYQHQDVPFEKVVEAVVKERDMSRSPLFQVMLVLQNNAAISGDGLPGIGFRRETVEHVTSKFDITFTIAESPEGFNGNIEYCRELFKEATIARMLAHFKQLLHAVTADPGMVIHKLNFLIPEEREQVMIKFNNTAGAPPRNKTIVSLFERQVASTPEDIAVEFGEERLTYRELNERSTRLANYLRQQGVKRQALVPICIQRGKEMLIGMLGILKAGAAYVPIDPSYPADRIKYMLEDTDAKLIVCSSLCKPLLAAMGEKRLILLDVVEKMIEPAPLSKVAGRPASGHLAYVIYTSGSTGRPKGVMIEHGSVVNFIKGITAILSFTGRKIYSLTSMSFDIFVLESLLSLCSGATVVIGSEQEQEDPVKAIAAMTRHKVHLLQVTPSRLKLLLDAGIKDAFSGLSGIMIGGETLPPDLPGKILAVCHARLYNMYGPTETTVWSTVKDLQADPVLTVGKPIRNTGIYVADEYGQMQGIGIYGEICISGKGLARGYWRQPGMTEDKFIPHPFFQDERMYKTGDVGRWLSNGELEIAGRKDDQVKIRGYRVELGEIENVLHQSGWVKQAAVAAQKDPGGNDRLIAYVVLLHASHKEEIMSYLKSKLPGYMVPARLVELEQLPLTSNGKVDRKSLPGADINSPGNDVYVAPRNETETRLAKIWQDVIGVSRVSIHDDFFSLGGHSLLLLSLIAAIQKEYEIELTIKEVLYEYPTLEALAGRLQGLNENSHDI